MPQSSDFPAPATPGAIAQGRTPPQSTLDKAHRNRVNTRVMKDKRMSYGGFKVQVDL